MKVSAVKPDQNGWMVALWMITAVCASLTGVAEERAEQEFSAALMQLTHQVKGDRTKVDESYVHRVRAIQVLVRSPDPRVLPALAHVVAHDPHGEVRTAALQALDALHDPEALPIFIKAVTDPEVGVRRKAAWILGTATDPQGHAALFKALENSDPKILDTTARGIEQIRDPNAVPDLIKAMDHSDSVVHLCAAAALLQMRDARVVPAFMRRLEALDAPYRSSFVRALGEYYDDPRVPPVLVKAMTDQDPDVRGEAAWALGRKQDLRALPYFERALGEKQKPNAYRAFEKHWNIVQCLATFQDEKVIPLLRKATKHPNVEIRGAAWKGLANFNIMEFNEFQKRDGP